MAFLTEVVEYEAGIYQLETTDPVVGGAGGVSNLQPNQLANRTAWLKQQIAALATSTTQQIGAVAAGNPLRDQTRGLTIANNAASPNSEVDIAATEAILQNSAGASLRASNIVVTANISAAGVNGLDTGAETASTWYHVWLISQGSGTAPAALLSISSNAPTLPAGYTFMAYVGAIYNNASSDFTSTHQTGNRAMIAPVGVAGLINSQTPISVALAVIPPTAKRLFGYIFLDVLSSGPAGAYISPEGGTSTSSRGLQFFELTVNSVPAVEYFPFALTLITPQLIYAWVGNTGPYLGISLTGWEY